MSEVIYGTPFGSPERKPKREEGAPTQEASVVKLAPRHTAEAEAARFSKELGKNVSLETYLDSLKATITYLKSLVWVTDEKDIELRQRGLAEKSDDELIAILTGGNRSLWQQHPSFYLALYRTLTEDIPRSVAIIKKLSHEPKKE